VLVIPEKRMLVIDTDVNTTAAACIPHAKKLTHGGKELLAVPFGTEEAMVLRNMGIDVPAPISKFYDWPGRFKPKTHQYETSAFLSMFKKALCLNAPGTGKTLASLWAADFLLTEGVIRKVLIVAPLSTVKFVWGTELKQHLPHRSFVICTGSRERRERLLETPGVQYVIINHDGFTTMSAKLTEFDLVIYDEATALKTPGSQRFKVFYNWVNKHKPWLWLMTGTPISQSPIDAWTLARLVDSPLVPKSFTTFKDMVMQKVTQFKWVPRPNALEICKKILQPSIRFTLDECVDLPQMNYVGRECKLTSQQEKAFKDMQDKAVTVFGSDGIVSAANTAVMLGKLLQICCGVVYGEKDTIAIDCKHRYEALTDLIAEIGDKVIVFVPHKGVQRWLMEKLAADKYSVELVNGDTGREVRNQIFDDFQRTDKPQILLAHPRVAAHGLTLTRAKDIIWYAPIYSLESYEQANARIRRLNTVGKTTVWHIWSTKFEAELYRRLRFKQNVLAEFLDLVRGINNDD
jgi:SNF2 family DNA or RNA helicase